MHSDLVVCDPASISLFCPNPCKKLTYSPHNIILLVQSVTYVELLSHLIACNLRYIYETLSKNIGPLWYEKSLGDSSCT